MHHHVHCLITVLNRELLKSALLVFKTIRVGFPTNPLFFYGNDLEPDLQRLFSQAARSVGGTFMAIPLQTHGEWIEHILAREREPFWIVDPDAAIYDDVSDWFDEHGGVLFSGRYEPEFLEPWTKTVHTARLHPSLMWFNSNPLRAAMRAWPGLHVFCRYVETEMIRWQIVPRVGQPALFYDTCAGLYQALGGTPFTDAQNACFAHLHNGTYLDLLEDRKELTYLHSEVFENPERARGLWLQQQRWYADHAVK